MRCREAQGEGKFEILQGPLDHKFRNVRTILIGDSIGEAAEDLFKLGYKVKVDYKGFKRECRSDKMDYNERTGEMAQPPKSYLSRLLNDANLSPTPHLPGDLRRTKKDSKGLSVL